jgi:hypothetical protein
MTVDELIEDLGLEASCKILGWQGGTIHQVREEMLKRFGENGIVQDKDGELVRFVFEEPPPAQGL